MSLRRALGVLFPVILLTCPSLAQAQSAKPVLDTRIVYTSGGVAKVGHVSKSKPEDTETNKIMASMIFYAYVMNKLDADARKVLINQVQVAVSQVATETGLQRPNILKDNILLKPLASATPKEVVITLSELSGQGFSLEVKPEALENTYLTAGVLNLYQDLIQQLPESGLRLLVLAMGAMNKFYRDGADPSDPANISKAPAYALNLAVDIITKVSAPRSKTK
jgi:hypothetical protein